METMERRERATEVEGDRPRWRDGIALGVGGVVVGTLSLMAVYGEVFADALVFLAVLAGLGLWTLRTPSTRLRWVVAALMAMASSTPASRSAASSAGQRSRASGRSILL